jgi:hypothetical protein
MVCTLRFQISAFALSSLARQHVDPKRSRARTSRLLNIGSSSSGGNRASGNGLSSSSGLNSASSGGTDALSTSTERGERLRVVLFFS